MGQEFPRHYTSLHIENMVSAKFDKETLRSMRQTYIRARYSEQDITKDDVSSMKAQVKKLKAESNVDGIRVDLMNDNLRDNRVMNGSWMTVGRGPEGNIEYIIHLKTVETECNIDVKKVVDLSHENLASA